MGGRAIGTYMYLPGDPSSGGVQLLAPPGGTLPVSCNVQVYAMGSAFEPDLSRDSQS